MIERRKSDRRKTDVRVATERRVEERRLEMRTKIADRLSERREQIADEAAKSGLHCINRFKELQRHTRGLNLGAIHLGGQVVV